MKLRSQARPTKYIAKLQAARFSGAKDVTIKEPGLLSMASNGTPLAGPTPGEKCGLARLPQLGAVFSDFELFWRLK
jgi:hypothetical protein